MNRKYYPKYSINLNRMEVNSEELYEIQENSMEVIQDQNELKMH